MKAYAVNVGTSIWTNARLRSDGPEWMEFDGLMQKLSKEPASMNRSNEMAALEEALVSTALTAYDEAPKMASAELASCVSANMEADDSVLLIVTDTADGMCCARALKRVLLKKLPVKAVSIEAVIGLQVHDAQLFLEQGVVNYGQVVEDFAQSNSDKEMILNITGGFKALIPYATIQAATRGWKMIYIYQYSDQLIEIPPLPISDFIKTLQEEPELFISDEMER